MFTKLLKRQRMIYMLLGAFLAVGLIFGAYATFAQSDDAAADDAAATETTPGRSRGDGRWFGRDGGNSGGQELADALGITVDELQAAMEKARSAALDQAVADGTLTQEQADALRDGSHMGRGHGFLGVDMNTYLAEALGISVEELQAAQETAFDARLKAAVEAGELTQAQADQMRANRAVAGYVDYEALNAAVQNVYRAAIEQALAAGAITQEQADQMLQNLPTMRGPRGFGMPDFGGMGRHGGGGGRHGGMEGFRGFGAPADTTTTVTPDL